MEKTNEVLDRVLTDLKTLISWADADADSSDESNALQQASDDRSRVLIYRQAYCNLATAFKQ